MLLEALIGLLLFTIGILGVIALQANSMRQTVDSKYRAEASYLANQIIAQMWVDKSNLASYVTSSPNTCPNAPANEREKWICTVQAMLPNATGSNSPTIAISGTTATVTVRWQKDTTNDPSHNFVAISEINGS